MQLKMSLIDEGDLHKISLKIEKIKTNALCSVLVFVKNARKKMREL